MSAISMFSALAVMGGATFAVFDDTSTATNNTFATGNANLQIATDTGSGPGTFVESIAGPNFSGIYPGQTKTFEFWLKNSSTAQIDLNLDADVSAISPDPDGDQLIDNTLLVSWVCDTDGDLSLGNNTPSSEFSPRDWFNGGSANLGSLTPGEQMICRMVGRLPSSADNSVANQTVIFNVEYGATQAP